MSKAQVEIIDYLNEKVPELMTVNDKCADRHGNIDNCLFIPVRLLKALVAEGKHE